jgi:hypothetical protein
MQERTFLPELMLRAIRLLVKFWLPVNVLIAVFLMTSSLELLLTLAPQVPMELTLLFVLTANL